MEVDEVRRSDDEFVVVRRSGVGTQEIAVSGPVVLDVAARREEETKPGMRVVLAARKKPQETFSFDELNGSERTFEIEGYHDPEAVVSNVYDGTEDVDGAVAQLVAAIRAEGVI
jgi:electron transfer flavoprotein beta subunit